MVVMVGLMMMLLFFEDSFIYLLVLGAWSWKLFVDYSWKGLFMFSDSSSFVMMVVMSVVILGLVLMMNVGSVMSMLSKVLVVVSVLFFVSGSLIMMYVYFELSMFPILFMVLGYGLQIEKVKASYYLIFYSMVCVLPFLLIYFKSEQWLGLVYFDVNYSWEMVLMLSLVFLVKFPVYFLHLWLPKVHVEAPTVASMLLAGLLLKLGTVGFLRIMKAVSFVSVGLWMVLSLIGMIMSSLYCVFQSDVKCFLAYSSISHMSFLLMSLILLTMSGKTSSLLMMVSHGYVSTLMFYVIGEFYHESSSRIVYFFSGLMSAGLLVVVVFILVMLGNAGVPPCLSFMSEFIGVSSMINLYSKTFVVLMIYFLICFYYSIYLMVNGMMGMSMLGFKYWNFGVTMGLLVLSFNLVWMMLIY